ncbi:MAG: helix-turn-helix transcriptional regulator [Oscillospiraceae bacterium]|nr:helix-turn-helix transcriptional regulator [Oscillospiraceae bacterium]
MPRKPMVMLTEAMFYVLMAFRQGEKCGIDVSEWIERHTGGRVKPGPATLYTILGKFEKEKLIKETLVEGRKRSYRITDKGLAAYEAELERLKKCVLDAEKEAEKHGGS